MKGWKPALFHPGGEDLWLKKKEIIYNKIKVLLRV
jgi:hypothetical protein